MNENFNEARRQSICDTRFEGFLHLQVTELPRDLCKWRVKSFDPYSVTLYVFANKKIEITLMDVHLTLTLPISGRKVKELMYQQGEEQG